MRRHLTVSVVLVAAVLVTACGAPERTASIARPTPTAPAAATTATAKCTPAATASYKPSSVYSPGAFPADSPMAKIVAKKQLVVGISADSRLLGSRNLATGQFQGIDIEMANRVAQALFGTSWRDHLVFKTISAAQRVPLLENGQVDMVARAMSMTCDRWNQVAFSEPYFVATQRVLVRRGSKENSLKALSDAGSQPNATKRRVCATSGSTSIQRLNAKDYPGIQPVGVALTTDCLVLWQQGRVDAITGDDAILAGLSQQDPAAAVPVTDAGVGAEPYGLAVQKANKEFVQFLNALLEQMRGNGDWQRAFAASGLQAVLKDKTQPPADFSRR
jgi:polar amino acid transport system substrate-binding protein